MRRLESAAVTDQGQVRKRNEDALLAGEAVFAVADGMGGHLAGDVAAETALEPIKALDGKVYADASTAQAAILDAVLAANMAVVRRAASDPGLRGMGTTLTATIVEGRRLHVGHVGDSRAYLFRHGRMTQLTRDHTLVARLIEEGRIKPEEAATHPQRSIITRAIGVDVDLEVDTLTIDLHDGDQVLLCSDGLTGPLTDDEILDVVNDEQDVDSSAHRLVELANEAGGPDNITVVLLHFVSDEPDEQATPAPAPDDTEVISASDLDTPDPVEEIDGHETEGEDATLDASDDGTGARRRRRIAIGIAAGVLLLIALIAAGWWLVASAYFVGVADDGDQIVIYRGVPGSIGALDLHWEEERTDLAMDDVAPWYRERLRDGVPATDLRDARLIVDNGIPRADGQDGEQEANGDGAQQEADQEAGGSA